MSPMKLVLSEALSTAFSPFTPVAPPEDALMLSQPATCESQLTDGSADPAVVAAASPEVVAPWLRAFGARRARGRGSAAPARRLAAEWLPDAGDPVDAVVDGPLSREQALAQPVAAGPANVGENCPKLDVVTALAGATAALPVAAPKTAQSTTIGTDSDESPLRVMLLRMPRISPSKRLTR